MNECDTENGGCAHSCNNYEGGRNCSCNAGYTLSQNRKDCDGKQTQYMYIYIVYVHSLNYTLKCYGCFNPCMVVSVVPTSVIDEQK